MKRILVVFVSVVAFCHGTILDTLKARHETTLLSLLQTAGLDSALAGDGPFTVFAPSNLAFARLGSTALNALKSDPNLLTNTLKYHVVSGLVTPDDLKVNEKMLDTLSGQKIRVNYYMYIHHNTVEGAMITSPAFNATNGIVYIVDSVLVPPNGTIADELASHPELATLKAALDAAGLLSALTDGPYTLFAPNEAAFNTLGTDKVNALLGNPELLSSVLLYHVIHGTLYSKGMHSGYLHNLEEQDRERLTASFSGSTGGTVSIDGARVVQKDISATNGVIHVINHVLIPSSLKTAIFSL